MFQSIDIAGIMLQEDGEREKSEKAAASTCTLSCEAV